MTCVPSRTQSRLRGLEPRLFGETPMVIRDRASARAPRSFLSLAVPDRPPRRNRNAVATLLTAVSLLAIGARSAHAVDDQSAKPQVSNEAMLKKLDAMEQSIKVLEGALTGRP